MKGLRCAKSDVDCPKCEHREKCRVWLSLCELRKQGKTVVDRVKDLETLIEATKE